jgi:hypothetical protein
MLATKGVFSEQRSCPVETVRVVGEDSDHTVYGEETPVAGKEGDAYPLGRTYVLKAGPEVMAPSSQLRPKQAIEESLRETMELCSKDGQKDAPIQEASEQDDEEPFPAPEETSEALAPGQLAAPDAMSQRIARHMKILAERVEWESWPRPAWWTPPWEGLGEIRNENGQRVIPISPLEFKENMTEDVFMTDEVMFERKIDPETGERIDFRSDPELVKVAAGVVWNAHGSTMFRRCAKDTDQNELMLSLFEWAVKLISDGCNMRYATHSDWLYDRWSDVMGWKAVDYQGLNLSKCSHQWRGTMEHMEGRGCVLIMTKPSDTDIEPRVREVVAQYAYEGVQWYKDFMATPLDGEGPAQAPWS